MSQDFHTEGERTLSHFSESIIFDQEGYQLTNKIRPRTRALQQPNQPTMGLPLSAMEEHHAWDEATLLEHGT
jgi:hypothetical protein